MSDSEDENFDIFVKDQGDIRGMIAYCIYRFEKKNFRRDRTATPDDKAAFRRDCVTGRRYDAIKDNAYEVLGRFIDGALKVHSAKKFWYDLRVGIIAGLLVAVLAPFTWHGVRWVIDKSGVAGDGDGVQTRVGK